MFTVNFPSVARFPDPTKQQVVSTAVISPAKVEIVDLHFADARRSPFACKLAGDSFATCSSSFPLPYPSPGATRAGNESRRLAAGGFFANRTIEASSRSQTSCSFQSTARKRCATPFLLPALWPGRTIPRPAPRLADFDSQASPGFSVPRRPTRPSRAPTQTVAEGELMTLPGTSAPIIDHTTPRL